LENLKKKILIQKGLDRRDKAFLDLLARVSFVHTESGDIKAVLGFSEFLEVPIVITSTIQRLYDTSTYASGPESLKSVYQEVIKSIKPYQDRISQQIMKFDSCERTRLQEAFHNLREKCYFSSVVNAVVALENRLLFLLKRENDPFLRNKRKDLRFTFGEIIRIYIDNKIEFNNFIPEKFENLMKLCNTYRIFSAHAKEENMTSNDTKVILSLTFSFLLDERCSIEKKIGTV
jgi:hypothetical protein